ncbi:hypothetical protein [Pseudoalteromonas porphyrae]|nr:hypothetical protein [Pseudoalteromonas porphyrae]
MTGLNTAQTTDAKAPPYPVGTGFSRDSGYNSNFDNNLNSGL